MEKRRVRFVDPSTHTVMTDEEVALQMVPGVCSVPLQLRVLIKKGRWWAPAEGWWEIKLEGPGVLYQDGIPLESIIARLDRRGDTPVFQTFALKGQPGVVLLVDQIVASSPEEPEDLTSLVLQSVDPVEEVATPPPEPAPSPALEEPPPAEVEDLVAEVRLEPGELVPEVLQVSDEIAPAETRPLPLTEVDLRASKEMAPSTDPSLLSGCAF